MSHGELSFLHREKPLWRVAVRDAATDSHGIPVRFSTLNRYRADFLSGMSITKQFKL